MSTQPLLTVDNLCTSFHTPKGDMLAVDGVSLTLSPGETLGIVGESGSGKSVLGRTIMGLIADGPGVSVTGTVGLGGRDVHALRPAERRRLWGPDVAMVFQDPMTSLNPVKRVGVHLTESLRFHLGLRRGEARERALELLQEVGIPEPARRLDQYPHELSGGMRQRVVIAMALACSPRLLIADEPTTALDVTVQKQILDLLESLSDRLEMATILISHDLGAVAGRTDRVAVMYAGRIVEYAATEALFARPEHPYTEALIASIPRLDSAPHTLLRTIEGHPPNMLAPPAGCRFAARCGYADAVCGSRLPTTRSLGDEDRDRAAHLAACHFPLGGTRAAAPAAAVRSGPGPMSGGHALDITEN